ncbi:MAG: stage III sporulation protein AE [Faecalimonas sp.]|nr:stage III sporulation protein AE [Faecalimonas sp.]
MRRKVWVLIGVMLLVLFSNGSTACAKTAKKQETVEASQSEIEEDLLSEFEFHELEEFLDEVFPGEKIGFFEMLQQLISGEMEFSLKTIGSLVTKQFAYEFQYAKTSIINLLAIVIIAAIFHNFAGVFRDNQVAEIGFFVLYLLLVTLCLDSFRVFTESVSLGLGRLLEFLQLLGPVYFLAVAFATGSMTSISFYNIILFLVCIVELVIQGIVLPAVQIYMMIRVLNNLAAEEYLSKFGELLHTLIVWALRALLGAVIGLNLIQGMLSPAIDAVKRSVMTRGGEALPIVGNLIGGTAEVVLGTAKLLQNGIGVAGLLVCMALCMAPVVQMVVITLLYKLTAALIQPISDKRIVGCISSVADGSSILLRVLFTAELLFLITIAIVANTGG